ncbi:YkgJ family cysteine cluster protein [Bacteroidota bacterium]
MIPDLAKFQQKARKQFRENEAFLKKLKQKKPKDLDAVVHQLHEEVFEQINCLDCANCCKTTSPAFYHKDIERLSRQMKMRPSEFAEDYLQLDDDGAYMFRNEPCPFLDAENYCIYYDFRPLACKEYPLTNRKRFYQMLPLTLKNTLICPAVLEIVNSLKKCYS